MKIKLKIKLILSIVLIVVMSIFHCGLFKTDNPEDPEGKKDIDPIDFKKILEGTGERFVFEDYNELFHDDFIYVDHLLISHTKNQLLSRLRDIEKDYPGGQDDTIEVEWFRINPDLNDDFDEDNEFELNPRGYYLLLGNVFLGDSLDTAYTGNATFKLRYNSDNRRWRISYWKDVPTDGAEKSFFHPFFPK